jgi:cellulose synthase (UDP-forming)
MDFMSRQEHPPSSNRYASIWGEHLTSPQTSAARIEKNLKSPSLMLLVLLATLGALNYGLFLFNGANRGDLLPYIMVLLAESFILLQAILTLWTVLASSYNPRNFEFHNTQDNLFGHRTKSALAQAMRRKFRYSSDMSLFIHGRKVNVDVFVTVYGEELDIVRRTVQAARDMMGTHTTYVLDDGKSDAVMALADELDVKYIRRRGNEGSKAGNINHALNLTDGEYFAIFDADFVASQRFLYETMPFFENERVAFVQTPQYYENTRNIISRGAGFMQHVFYALILPGKNRFNAAFCVGTNVVFRRSATDTIGGIYQRSKSEDIWTSILLHEKGFESVYIPTVLAIGRTPDTIEAYTKQQLRWATGAFEILFRHNPFRIESMTFDQRLQYLGTVSYYLGGFAVLLLLLLPSLQIFLNLSPVNLGISFAKWAFYYSSFYLLQIAFAFYAMGGFKLQALLLASVSAPIYIRACFNALLKREQTWQATGATSGRYMSPFNFIVPQIYLFIFLALTTVVGIWKTNYTATFSVALAWNAINTAVLGAFLLIAWKESFIMRRKNSHHRKKIMVRYS